LNRQIFDLELNNH